MASGSDYGVAHHSPWLGLYALLTRIDQVTGEALGADETLGIEEALRSYTINGAYVTYDDDLRGSLEVGKLADPLATNNDPFGSQLGVDPTSSDLAVDCDGE